MIPLVQNTTDLEISRTARKFFRVKDYDQLFQLLKNIPQRSSYLESLYQRASLELHKKEATPLVKRFSPSLFENISKHIRNRASIRHRKEEILAQITTIDSVDSFDPIAAEKEKELFSTQKTESMTSMEKIKFKREREKILEESGKILVDTLQAKDELAKKALSEDEKLQTEHSIQEKEMQLAQTVQMHLLPKIDQHILPGIDSFVKTINASELSGDVYDFVIPNEHEILFYLGDVTGHGTAAGLVMSMISCLSHSILEKTTNILQAVISLNKEIKPKLQKNMFTTMVMCKWHAVMKEFSFVGAGHEHILHYQAKTKIVQKIPVKGVAIGMLPDLSKIIKEQKIHLEHDDVLLLYTDGIDEAWDEKKEKMYSTERLMEVFQKNATLLSAEIIGEEILRDVRAFQGNGVQADDITLMIFRRKVSQDEREIKNTYLKQKIKNDLLADEVIMESKNESFNPHLKGTQDDFVKKSMTMAAILIDEHNYFAAREILKKALSYSPNNQSLQAFFAEVEEKIMLEETGIFKSIKNAIIRFFQSSHKTEFHLTNKKDQYLKILYNDAKTALQQGDTTAFEKIQNTMRALDPNSHYLKKIENSIIHAAKHPEHDQVIIQQLKQIFSLELAQLSTDAIKPDTEEYSIRHKKDLDMKTKNVTFKINPDDKFTESPLGEDTLGINEEYSPSQLLDDDVMGLKNLLKFKGEKKEKEQLQQTPQNQAERKKDQIGSMKWEKGGVMDLSRKKYNKFMAKISPMNTKDLFSFIEKLSAFVKAGIPIQKSLEIMQEQATNDGYIFVLDELNISLDKGKLLSQAMQQFPQQFPEMLVYLVHSGEKSGALSVILSDLAEKMKEQQIIRSKIIGAMIYPAVIISASLTIVISMLVFIVPKLTKVYKDTGVDLPKITQVIIQISDFMQTNYLSVIGGIIAIIVSLILFGKTKIGVQVYHKIVLYLPVVRMMSIQNNVMLFTSNLGILLENGVQLSEALGIVAKITPNYYYSQEILAIRGAMISKGINLSEAMGIKMSYAERKSLFPLEVIQMISIGEKVGNLSGMLKSSGQMLSERIRTTVKSLSELLEPILILCVGLLVATILLAIMLPLFNIGRVLRKQ